MIKQMDRRIRRFDVALAESSRRALLPWHTSLEQERHAPLR